MNTPTNLPLKCILYGLLCCLTFSSLQAAEGIRVRPKSITVENDSLRIYLMMDLSRLRVASGKAYIFTPILQGQKVQLPLPPVIFTGSRRFRFDRRERALAIDHRPVEPYRIVVDNSKRANKEITYRVAIPYASWMEEAALAVKEESKDCCTKRVLSVNKLIPNILDVLTTYNDPDTFNQQEN